MEGDHHYHRHSYQNQRPYYNNRHYYYDDSYYDSSDSYGYRQSSRQYNQPQPLPLHLCCFFAIIFLFLTLSWYLSYEPSLESLFDGVKLALMLLPVLFLLVLHCLSGVDHSWASLLLPLQEEHEAASHGQGSSPWGVACVLLLLIFMASYRSTFLDGWFPLISR